MTLRITTLVENTKLKEHFACESGLALFIEWRDKTILLDCGATEIFLDNAEVLDKNITRLDYVILSHGHSDHSGGLRNLCHNTRRNFSLVLNPHFFDKKFVRDREYLRYVGNDFNEEFLRMENIATLFPLQDTFTLMEDVYILSGIKRAVAFEEEANGFIVLRGGEYTPDLFEDEQILVFDLPKGLVVITGCGHCGVANICEAVKQRLQKPIQAIIGGLHMKNSGNERIEATAAYLREQGISRLALGHCTGENVIACLEAAGSEILPLSSGAVLEF